MDILLITYESRIRALCTPQRVYLAEDPYVAGADSSARFVLAMCLYAGEILQGRRLGPYREVVRARTRASC